MVYVKNIMMGTTAICMVFPPQGHHLGNPQRLRDRRGEGLALEIQRWISSSTIYSSVQASVGQAKFCGGRITEHDITSISLHLVQLSRLSFNISGTKPIYSQLTTGVGGDLDTSFGCSVPISDDRSDDGRRDILLEKIRCMIHTE